MASEFFGLKGKLVRQYQQILNSLGANLKVGGKWGKKTEDAFNKYRDQFLEAIGMKAPEPTPYVPMEHTNRTQEELLSAAQGAYGAMHGDQMEQLERTARDRQDEIAREMDGLEPAYQQQAASVMQRYAQNRQSLSDAALSRGLGRSSYVTDQIAGSQKREESDIGSLEEQTRARRQSLSDAALRVKGDLSDTTARLLGERENKILSAIDEYRMADQKSEREALQYNNQMLEKQNAERLQREQFERELRHQLQLARMKR